MPLVCSRCATSNPELARFCGNCGLMLEVGAHGVLGAGRAPHPEPLTPLEGFEPIALAANLYFHWGAAGGGAPLLGTETLAVTVFNGGYDLAEVVLRVRGVDDKGVELLAVERELENWPRGESAELEIPSYELPDPVQVLNVELVRAEFAGQE